MVLAGILIRVDGGEVFSLFGVIFFSPISSSACRKGYFVSESEVSRGSLNKADID